MFVTELEGGTLTSSARRSSLLLVRRSLLFGVVGVWIVVGVGGLVVGTLLGPEGVGRLCWFLGSPGSWVGRVACSVGGLLVLVPPGLPGLAGAVGGSSSVL